MPMEAMLSLPGSAAGDAMRLSAISALPGSPRWQTGGAEGIVIPRELARALWRGGCGHKDRLSHLG